MSEVRPVQKWACEYCTYENWPASKKCTLCRAPKPLQYICEEVPADKPDIYQMGSLASPSESPSSSNTSVRSSSEQSNKWACQVCTYLNWPKAARCTQCLMPRSPPVKVVARTTSAGHDRMQPLSINVSIGGSLLGSAGAQHSSPRTSPNSPEAAKALNNDKNKIAASVSSAKVAKWSCRVCTYENWPRSLKCVLCGVPRGKSYTSLSSASDTGNAAMQDPMDDNKLCSSASKRQSPSSSMHRIDNINKIEQLGGATASANIYDQQEWYGDSNKNEENRIRRIRTRLKECDWLWLNACQGVIEGDTNAVEAYLMANGDPARQLTSDDCTLLNRPSAFEVGYTLVHLAIRFQREDMLTALLTSTDVVATVKKRVPSHVAPDVASDILRGVASTLRQRKGDFRCYFLTEMATFALPADIDDLPIPIKKDLFDELLDKDVQKELESEEPIINWSAEITERLGSRLYALWNRTAGDCLLDSVLQASWGIFDSDNTLRRALADSLSEGATAFYSRWKETETLQAQSLHFTLDENQWSRDWAVLLSLASQPGASLEQIHIFALAHILRRPIIVYGIKFVKSFRGENIGLARFQGVYLPLLWEQSFCWRTPLALGYTRGHFSALISMEADTEDENVGAGANSDNNDGCGDHQRAYLPLTDSEGKLLPIHFLPASEFGREEGLFHMWMDCHMTDGGLLVAEQQLTTRPELVRQMVDEWLDRYRQLAQVIQSTACTAPPGGCHQNLSSDDETDDE
ncbi:Ubiquitin thioesterase zranb1-B [Lamellibrachia satsuma]|nr:Ubiquitin thioesterase zranb1-B [Lamellibrachia satsuma]